MLSLIMHRYHIVITIHYSPEELVLIQNSDPCCEDSVYIFLFFPPSRSGQVCMFTTCSSRRMDIYLTFISSFLQFKVCAVHTAVGLLVIVTITKLKISVTLICNSICFYFPH